MWLLHFLRRTLPYFGFICSESPPPLTELKNCIVLSNKGPRGEAERMSGGDYDGDMAWVSWDRDLLLHLHAENPAEDLDEIKDEPCVLGQKSAWGKDNKQSEINYVLQFRFHHVKFGTLARQVVATVDQKGFNSFEARQLGRGAFLQVDVPDKRKFDSLQYC